MRRSGLRLTVDVHLIQATPHIDHFDGLLITRQPIAASAVAGAVPPTYPDFRRPRNRSHQRGILFQIPQFGIADRGTLRLRLPSHQVTRCVAKR